MTLGGGKYIGMFSMDEMYFRLLKPDLNIPQNVGFSVLQSLFGRVSEVKLDLHNNGAILIQLLVNAPGVL